MKVLLTGFEPFGGEKINPSFEAVMKVKDYIEEIEIIKIQLPTVFKKSIEVLDAAIVEHKPDKVICVGQAAGRFNITIERVAINLVDARIADNEGNQPIDEEIFSDGENAYFSNAKIKTMVEKIKESSIPASISETAGTFVCNETLYGLLYLINKKYKTMQGCFIHVPFIPEQVIDKPNTPYMELNTIVRALEIAIRYI